MKGLLEPESLRPMPDVVSLVGERTETVEAVKRKHAKSSPATLCFESDRRAKM